MMTPSLNYPPSRYYFLTLVIALLLVAASFYLEHVFQNTGASVQTFLGTFVSTQFLLLFIAMLVVKYCGPNSQNLKDYQTLLIVAVITRVLLFPIDPYLSNDVDRYLFDGYIASIGLDPYTVSHNSPLLKDAVSQWAPPIEHLKYATLYPPMALALFAIAASFGPDLAPIAWKVLVISAGISTLFVGALILKRLNKLHHLALIALSPILILETGVGVHVDAFSTLFIALAIYALLPSERDKGNVSISAKQALCAGVFIGLGTLTKLLPIVLLAPLVISLSKRSFKSAGYLLIGALGIVVLGYAISFALGLTPIGSIGVFFEKFRFGSPYFYWLEQQFSLPRVTLITSIIFLVSFAVVGLLTWSKSQYTLDKNSVIAMQVSLCIPLFLSPVVYTWYLAPLAFLVALSPNLPLLVWLGFIPLTYEVLGKWTCCNEWSPSTWPLSMIAIGLSLSFAFVFFKHSRLRCITKPTSC